MVPPLRDMPSEMGGGMQLGDKLFQLVVKAYRGLSRHVVLPIWQIRVETTKSCNLKCPGCRRNFKASISSEPGARHLTVGMLELMIRDTSTKVVRWEGDGEPLANPHFKDLIKYCGLHRIKSMLCTNGTLLTREYVRLLEENGVFRIHISFDGARRDTYERLRVGADYDKVIYNCKMVGESKIPLFMSIVLFNEEIIEELPEYVELGKRVGAAGIHMLSLQQEDVGFYGLAPDLSKYENELKRFRGLVESNGMLFVSTVSGAPHFVDCDDAYTNPYGLLNGDIYPCQYIANLRRGEVYQGIRFTVPHLNYKMGNLYETTMQKAWHSKGWQELRKVLKESRQPRGKVILPGELLEMKRSEETNRSRFSYCAVCPARWGVCGK